MEGGGLPEREEAAGRGDEHGLQARERSVSITMTFSGLFLWKMSAHETVSWWQSWGFLWIDTPPFRISVGQGIIRGFFPCLSPSVLPPSKRGRGFSNILQVPQAAEKTPSSSFSPAHTDTTLPDTHMNQMRSREE